MIIKKIIPSLITLLLIGQIFISVKATHSSYLQAFMIYDFNNESYNVPYEHYANKLDANFPSLSHTALPMKFIKARYFLELDSLEITKTLLHGAIKQNPFIKGPEEMLARIFLKEENYDSAYFYSKEAFYKMPNVGPHRFTFFRVLEKRNDSIELEKAFKLIKSSKRPSNWYDYIYAKFKINNNDKSISDLIDEFKQRFPNEDAAIINDISNFVNFGSEAFTLYTLFVEVANDKFKNENYEEAVGLYEKAIDYNSGKYFAYENAAIAYDLSNEYGKALEYFNKVIYEFKPNDGRSEFYKGLMLLKINNISGCDYLKIASEKRYVSEGTGFSGANVYYKLCQNNINN